MKKLYISFFLCLTIILGSVSSHASSIVAGDYLGGGFLTNWSGATGYEFTVNSDITVIGLGVYDFSTSGLASSHDIGIFLSDGTSVINTTIGNGSIGTYVPGTVDGSRFSSISPTLLASGTTYFILGDNFNTDQYAYGNGSVVFAPEITWNSYVQTNSNSIFGSPVFRLPGQTGNLGPNFIYSTSPIPEPATMLLFSIGLIALVGVNRKKNEYHQ